MKQATEVAAILVAIVLACGLVLGALMLKPNPTACLVLLCAAIVCAGTAAIAASILLARTKPVDVKHF